MRSVMAQNAPETPKGVTPPLLAKLEPLLEEITRRRHVCCRLRVHRGREQQERRADDDSTHQKVPASPSGEGHARSAPTFTEKSCGPGGPMPAPTMSRRDWRVTAAQTT